MKFSDFLNLFVERSQAELQLPTVVGLSLIRTSLRTNIIDESTHSTPVEYPVKSNQTLTKPKAISTDSFKSSSGISASKTPKTGFF